MPGEIRSAAELDRAAGGDPLIVWAGQGLRDGATRAWRLGDAVVVAAPDLSRRDRLAVLGPVGDLVPLVEQVFAEVGPAYRPFGDEDLMRALADRVAGLEFRATFGWMDTRTVQVVDGDAGWIDDDEGIAALLRIAAPDSYAWPGGPGVLRWAAVAESNELLSVAADAWSAPDAGFLAGVASAPSARGRGHSYAVCGFVTAELLREHGLATLMVDSGNEAAIRIYAKLGYAYRGVAAAALTR